MPTTEPDKINEINAAKQQLSASIRDNIRRLPTKRHKEIFDDFTSAVETNDIDYLADTIVDWAFTGNADHSIASAASSSESTFETEPDGGSPVAVWRLMACHQPERYDEVIQWIRSTGVIAIGWGDTGDLNKISFDDEKALTRIVADVYPQLSAGNHAHGGRSLWNLYREVKIGDLVIVNTSKRALTMRVVGDYYFGRDSPPVFYEHRRAAEVVDIHPDWLWHVSGGFAKGQGVFPTLVRCEKAVRVSEFATTGA